MEPLIRNVKDFPAGTPARLISADDNPSLVTLAYSVIEPGGTSSHHIHEWEHEVYIIEGSGTLVADGKEYPVKAGDAMFIPPMVDHVTRNDGDGNIRRIEINPLAAASGNARPGGSEPGAGTPPVIRNHADLNAETGHTMLGGRDGCPNYLMLYNGAMQPRRGEPSGDGRAQPRMGPHRLYPGGDGDAGGVGHGVHGDRRRRRAGSAG